NGITNIGISPLAQFGIFIYLIVKTTRYPAKNPPIKPPIKPAPTAFAVSPIIKPGAIPGLSAIEYAIPVAITTGNIPNPSQPSVAKTSQNEYPGLVKSVDESPPSAIPIAIINPAPQTTGIR